MCREADMATASAERGKLGAQNGLEEGAGGTHGALGPAELTAISSLRGNAANVAARLSVAASAASLQHVPSFAHLL